MTVQILVALKTLLKLNWFKMFKYRNDVKCLSSSTQNIYFKKESLNFIFNFTLLTVFGQCNTQILLDSINKHVICLEDRSSILQYWQKQLEWQHLGSQFMWPKVSKIYLQINITNKLMFDLKIRYTINYFARIGNVTEHLLWIGWSIR